MQRVNVITMWMYRDIFGHRVDTFTLIGEVIFGVIWLFPPLYVVNRATFAQTFSLKSVQCDLWDIVMSQA